MREFPRIRAAAQPFGTAALSIVGGFLELGTGWMFYQSGSICVSLGPGAWRDCTGLAISGEVTMAAGLATLGLSFVFWARPKRHAPVGAAILCLAVASLIAWAASGPIAFIDAGLGQPLAGIIAAVAGLACLLGGPWAASLERRVRIPLT